VLYKGLILVCSFDGCKLARERAVLNSARSKSLFDEEEVMKNRIHCKRPDPFSFLVNETKSGVIFCC